MNEIPISFMYLVFYAFFALKYLFFALVHLFLLVEALPAF